MPLAMIEAFTLTLIIITQFPKLIYCGLLPYYSLSFFIILHSTQYLEISITHLMQCGPLLSLTKLELCYGLLSCFSLYLFIIMYSALVSP